MSATGQGPARPGQPIRDSLREALGAFLCWLAAAWLRLDLGYLSVITLHLVNNLVKTGLFQPSVERFVGRALGVACALAIVTAFHQAPALSAVFTLLGVVIFSYINLAGW
jgi:uncharacterized membrane protein YgaE (UPF0421/DUF939 family)